MALRLDDVIPVPDALVASPIEWFVAHHQRCRQVCRLVEELAGDPDFDEPALRLVLAYLRDESPQHLADEEQQLFPALQQCCTADDDVDPVLVQLIAEHRSDLKVAQRVAEHLEACVANRAAPALLPESRDLLQAFAAHERGHLALENAVVLPFARLRLSEDDLSAMSEAIALRRGIRHPGRPRAPRRNAGRGRRRL
jgi:hemerythrin-like domain-containing protein